MKKTITAVLLLLLMAGSAAAVSVGDRAPEIKAAGWLNTSPLTLAALRGRIVVVEFWATWCPPCRRSIPHLIQLYNSYKGKPVTFISLSSESKSRIERFNNSNPSLKMPYPVGYGSRTSSRYGVRGIPHAFVIGKTGKILWRGHPMSSGFKRAIAKALQTRTKVTPPGNNTGKDNGGSGNSNRNRDRDGDGDKDGDGEGGVTEDQ